MCFFYYQ